MIHISLPFQHPRPTVLAPPAYRSSVPKYRSNTPENTVPAPSISRSDAPAGTGESRSARGLPQMLIAFNHSLIKNRDFSGTRFLP